MGSRGIHLFLRGHALTWRALSYVVRWCVMMRCVRMVNEPSVRVIPVDNVMAGMIWTMFGVDLYEIRRPGFVSHFSPSLHRPVVWTERVQ